MALAEILVIWLNGVDGRQIYTSDIGWHDIPTLQAGTDYSFTVGYKNLGSVTRELIMGFNVGADAGTRYATVAAGQVKTEQIPGLSEWYVAEGPQIYIRFDVQLSPEGMQDSVDTYIPVATAVNGGVPKWLVYLLIPATIICGYVLWRKYRS